MTRRPIEGPEHAHVAEDVLCHEADDHDPRVCRPALPLIAQERLVEAVGGDAEVLDLEPGVVRRGRWCTGPSGTGSQRPAEHRVVLEERGTSGQKVLQQAAMLRAQPVGDERPVLDPAPFQNGQAGARNELDRREGRSPRKSATTNRRRAGIRRIVSGSLSTPRGAFSAARVIAWRRAKSRVVNR
jgi:hypothetical protein